MKVGVAGAGIGGLALAAMLARAGHEVMVFDQFDAPRPVGSGLVIQPVGMAVLDAVGAGAAARAAGQPIRRMQGLEVGAGRVVLDVAYAPPGAAPDRMGLAIHRASLHAALLSAVTASGLRITTGHRIETTMICPRGRWLGIGGDRLGPFDLVVDATGAASCLSPLQARSLPYGAVWGTVPWPKTTPLPRDELTQRYRRADRMAGVLPLGTVPGREGPQAAIFWSLPVTGMEDWRATGLAAWKAEAAELWPDYADFLEAVTDPGQMVSARYSHGSLRRPFAPRLAFLGDAAHRASPQLGQGANMALLDALALARALERALAAQGRGEALEDRIASALADHARMRRWHLRLYQALSAAFTPQYQSDSRVLPVLRDRFLAPLSQIPPLPTILSRLVAGRLLPPLAGETGI
ncbi:FAD-dependent oxidoreductase [Szabonella alba]|uniref:FAD-dependent monooxygenase n=1 Tax=Szabonella alba TaxID=2804194 RepID=A0A8K0VA37_9RHOB|nr:FAD-dependent monooxygenase [Szabonella alba]MBL4916145.1 FAD-dependent monooxygenase [Szabonella alba]